MAREKQAYNVAEWIIALQGHPRSSLYSALFMLPFQ